MFSNYMRNCVEAPIPLAEPGNTNAVVTPPEMESLYASSWVFKPSNARNQGCVIPWRELPSPAPLKAGAELTPR